MLSRVGQCGFPKLLLKCNIDFSVRYSLEAIVAIGYRFARVICGIAI